MGIMKAIGNATIVKQCTTLAGWLTTHPYLTYFAYNAIVLGIGLYMYESGRRLGRMEGLTVDRVSDHHESKTSEEL